MRQQIGLNAKHISIATGVMQDRFDADFAAARVNVNAWLLMRADARGLSGMLMASTPTDFTKRAPSSSLRMSVPLGGTISTMVTNSPRGDFTAKAGTLIEGTRRRYNDFGLML